MKKKLLLLFILFLLFVFISCKKNDIIKNENSDEVLKTILEKTNEIEKSANPLAENQEITEKNTFSVIVHVGSDVYNYVISTNHFEFNDFELDKYDYYGIYTDPLFENAFDGIVSEDIELYLKVEAILYKTIKYFINGEFVEEKRIRKDSLIPNIIEESSPYYNLYIYSDENNTTLFTDFSIKEDTTLYYEYTRKEEYLDKIIVNIHSGNYLTHYVLDKGDALEGDLAFCGIWNNDKLINLYLDSDLTIPYGFGPINEDLELYSLAQTKEYSEFMINPRDCCVVNYFYVLPTQELINVGREYKEVGSIISPNDFMLRLNYFVSDIYLDEKCSIKASDFAIEEGQTVINLYGKVDEEPSDAHKVTIYYGPTISEGIEAESEYSNDTIYREFYVRNGAKLNEIRMLNEEMRLYHVFYKNDFSKVYDNSPIFEDVEFIVLNGGLPFDNKFQNVDKHYAEYCIEGKKYGLYFINNDFPSTYDLGLKDVAFYIDENCTTILTKENYSEDINILYIK